MSTVTAQPTKQQTLVDALRALADTIEQHDLDIGKFASVGFGKVGIGSDAFTELFRGQSLRGSLSCSMVSVEAEYAGVVFSTNLFRPEENSSFVTVCVGE